MKLSQVESPYSLDDVKAANEKIVELDEQIEAARARIAECNERCGPLRAKIDEVKSRPPKGFEPDAAQVEALLADPSAQIDMTAISEASEAARKENELRSHEVRTIQEAIKQVDGIRSGIESRLSALQDERRLAYEDFAKQAQSYLMGEFIAQFDQLLDRVMNPLDAFSHGRDIPMASMRIDRRCEVIVEEWTGTNWADHRLFPGNKTEAERAAAIESYRASLLKK